MISGKHIRLLIQEKDTNINRERNMTMKESKSVTKAPICGMTVEEDLPEIRNWKWSNPK